MISYQFGNKSGNITDPAALRIFHTRIYLRYTYPQFSYDQIETYRQRWRALWRWATTKTKQKELPAGDHGPAD